MAEQARIAITAEDRFSRVVADAQSQFAGLRGTLAGLASVGGALSAGAAAAWLNNIVEGLDRFNDLKAATGASVANLSALEDVILRGGKSFEAAGDALVKFNLALNNAKPDSDAARVFERLGLSVAELKRADPVEALRQVSVAFGQFADDGNKARAAQVLFGRSLQEVAPILATLAEAGQLNGKVTEEQARQADAFNQQVGALRKNSLDFSRAVVGDLLPALNDLVGAFNAARGAGSGLSVIGAAIKTVLQTVSVVGANVAFVFQGVGREIGAIAAQLRALASGNLQAFGAIREALISDNERARAELDAFEQRVLGVGEAAQQSAPPLERAARSIGEIGAAAKRSAAELALFRSANEGIAGEFEARVLMMKRLADEQERLNELTGQAQTDKLRADLALLDKAFFDGAISAQKYDEALGRLLGKAAQDNIKKTDDAAEKLGLTIASSLGRFIEAGGSIGDLFKAITQDILKLIVQLAILEPLAKSIRDAFKGIGGGSGGGLGSILGAIGSAVGIGGAGGGAAGASGAGAVRVQSTGAGVTINQTVNVGQGVSRAEVASAMEQSRAATLASLVDLQRRGRLALGA